MKQMNTVHVGMLVELNDAVRVKEFTVLMDWISWPAASHQSLQSSGFRPLAQARAQVLIW